MFVVYFGVLLAGITWRSEGALVFTKKPEGPVYFLKGSNATLEWEYSVDDRATELKFVIWKVENKTASGDFDTLLYENENFVVTMSSKIPAAYDGRVEKKNPATLVIKNITFEDSTLFACVLQGKGLVGNQQSDVQLVVIGPASVNPRFQFAELGRSATFTCNATGVPSANFTWMRKGKERITGDARHTIVSVTGSSQLTIKSITAGDHGYYACDATVNQQANAASFSLQVPSKLTEQLKDDPCNKRNYSVAVGEQLSISCPVRGHPPPIVTWEKNGIQFLKGENVRLCFNPVKVEDFGMYTCTATDIESTIGPLTIRVKPISGLIEYFDDLAITESTDGTPEKPAKLVWAPHAGAENYVVKIIKNDYLFDDEFLIGTGTSVEFHYHTLVLKKAESKPKAVDIDVEVIAMNETRVVAKTPMLQKLTVKLPSDTKN